MSASGKGFIPRLLGLLIVASMCGAVFLFFLRTAGGLDIGSRYHFEAVVPTVQQMVPQADVMEGGVRVGKVTGISNRGATAVVAVALEKKYGPMHTDGTVRVRVKTLVGENYLEIDPGTPTQPKVPENGLVPIQQAQDAVQLDEVLSTIGPQRRKQVRALVSGLGGGVRNSQDLNDTLEALSATVDGAQPLVAAAASERQALATLVDDLGQVFNALGTREEAIQQLVHGGLGAARAFAAQNKAVAAGLRALPSTLSQAQSTTAHLAAVGEHATPVLDDLGGSLDALLPAARALPGASTATLAALRRLHTVTPLADHLLTSLRKTVGPAQGIVPPLGELLRNLRPSIEYLSPFAKDLAYLTNILRTASNTTDSLTHLVRVTAYLSATAIVGLPTGLTDSLRKLENSGLINLLTTKGVNYYPHPGSIEHPQAYDGSYKLVPEDPPIK